MFVCLEHSPSPFLQYVLHPFSRYVQLTSNFSTTAAWIRSNLAFHFSDHYFFFRPLFGRYATLPVSRQRAMVRETKDLFTFICWRALMIAICSFPAKYKDIILLRLNYTTHNFLSECNRWKCFCKLIHTYIHNRPLQPFSRDYGLASHSTHFVCVNFIHECRDLQFNVDSERQIFDKLLHGRFIYSQSFW